MAPEQVFSLLALRLRFENGRLLATGERVDKTNDPIYVSWYVSAPVAGQVPIAEGLVSVPDEPDLLRHAIQHAEPADLGDGRHKWRDPAPAGGPMMLAMALPAGCTLKWADPPPVEAKEEGGGIAVFWILPAETQVSLEWCIEKSESAPRAEVQRINREGVDTLLKTRGGGFEYEVALSFAGEDRLYVEEVATALRDAGVTVFYDGFEEADLWGKNLYEHLSDVYGRQARYTVMFISKHYASKSWTSHEREVAQARAFEENSEYVLPVRFDDTPVPGLSSTVGYLSLQGREPASLARLIVEKLGA